METNGEEITLPDCAAPFLVSRLLEIGPVISGPMGVAPISWRDLEAWQFCSKVELPPWQSRMLVDLSREYTSFSVKAEKADCPPPWEETMTEGRREAIARGLALGFRSMLKG